MAQVTVRRNRIVVTPRAQSVIVKLLPVPDTNLVFALTQDFIRAYRRGAA